MYVHLISAKGSTYMYMYMCICVYCIAQRVICVVECVLRVYIYILYKVSAPQFYSIVITELQLYREIMPRFESMILGQNFSVIKLYHGTTSHILKASCDQRLAKRLDHFSVLLMVSKPSRIQALLSWTLKCCFVRIQKSQVSLSLFL